MSTETHGLDAAGLAAAVEALFELSPDVSRTTIVSTVVRAYLAATPSAATPAGEVRVRHKKRGTEYEVLGVGKMQSDTWQVSRDGFDRSIDMEPVTIYRGDDGELWVRPRDEFEDGRFEALAATPAGEDETGWLVELKQSVVQIPTWFTISDDEEDWTTDASKALRFARKEDAEAIIRFYGWTEAFASEHIWSAPRRSALASQPPTTPPLAPDPTGDEVAGLIERLRNAAYILTEDNWHTEAASCNDAADTFAALRDETIKVVEPFATFGEDNTDTDGWAGNRCERERIVDWFGPSDFRAASALLAKLKGRNG